MGCGGLPAADPRDCAEFIRAVSAGVHRIGRCTPLARRVTRWQLANRRQIGLGFAVSHTIHAAAIAGFAWLDPLGFHAATGPGNFVSGGLAYVFIVLMAATSFDGAVRWLGARRWRLLHLAGLYFVWISFLITFGKRIPISAATCCRWPSCCRAGAAPLAAAEWAAADNESLKPSSAPGAPEGPSNPAAACERT